VISLGDIWVLFKKQAYVPRYDDHLAGELGVALYEALTRKGYIINNQSETIFTESGRRFFLTLGVDFDEFKVNKRPLCKYCLDWSERKNHLTGLIGQWILNDIYQQDFAKKDQYSRAIEFTDKGLKMFNKKYGVFNNIDMSWRLITMNNLSTDFISYTIACSRLLEN
jgi:hypothetical protein